ncbi:unnamed protein product [Moneuplotes crassus]|uniref:Uncharacterized protein n=1 Tax=Euplotes crassus TaxID=5936 RepID=A0AAD2D2K3_EUPCR|nr:unnamed protein product [Moneuplotes crassus]
MESMGDEVKKLCSRELRTYLDECDLLNEVAERCHVEFGTQRIDSKWVFRFVFKDPRSNKSNSKQLSKAKKLTRLNKRLPLATSLVLHLFGQRTNVMTYSLLKTCFRDYSIHSYRKSDRNMTSLNLINTLIDPLSDLRMNFMLFSKPVLRIAPYLTKMLRLSGFEFTNKSLMKIIMLSNKCQSLYFHICNVPTSGLKLPKEIKSNLDIIEFEDINLNMSLTSSELNETIRSIMKALFNTSLCDTVDRITVTTHFGLDWKACENELNVSQRDLDVYNKGPFIIISALK